MLGAIIGDIAGSSYEHPSGRVPGARADAVLFPPGSRFTDDSVMTCAVAEAMLKFFADGRVADLHELFVKSMRAWGNRYPYAGYGAKFQMWLESDHPLPYNSFGNGSAMRVSPVAWFAKTLEETEDYARISAEVTHNHVEGIKGAQAVAGAIFLARHKADKDAIATYVRKYYSLDFTLDEIRPEYRFEVSCQRSVPQAIMCFLEADSFENAIRNAISLGGDTDTQAAMAGSIAEPFYGIPDEIVCRVERLISPEINAVWQKFKSVQAPDATNRTASGSV